VGISHRPGLEILTGGKKMKKFLTASILTILMLFTASTYSVEPVEAPTGGEIFRYDNHMPGPVGLQLGTNLKNMVLLAGRTSATFDVSVDGNLSSATSFGTGLGANAIIWRTLIHVPTAVTSLGGTGFVTFDFGDESSSDIGTYAVDAILPGDSIILGAQDGTVANAVILTNPEKVTATLISGGTLQAGKVTVFVDYYQSQ